MRPPHDMQAEQAVLATLALKPALADDLAARLPEPDCFFDGRHQVLYTALLNLARRNETPDGVTVAAELAALGELRRFRGRDDVGAYLLDICSRVPGTRNYEAYAKIVARAWVARRIQRSNTEIAELAGVPQTEITALLMQMQKESVGLLGLADFRPTRRFNEVAYAVLEDAVDRQAEARAMVDGAMLGLPTGIPGLSELVGGLRRASFCVGAGAPGWGKSTMMMQMADAIAASAPSRFNGDPDSGGAHIVSIEMTAAELVGKTLMGHAQVDSQRVYAGKADDVELGRLNDTMARIGNRRIFIDDLAAPSWPQIRAKIILAYEQHGIEVAFIDYLQKIPKPARMEKKDHVAEIAAGCKSLAKQLDICIVGMAQLKRPEGRRKQKPAKPQMTDLAESAALEREADLILLLWPRDPVSADLKREGYYLREHTDIVVAKNRGGVTGDVNTIFNKTLQIFEPPPQPTELTWVGAVPSYHEKETPTEEQAT